jgi:excisionase family DNA binding protein
VLSDPRNQADEVPVLLTVEEAARVLRIGRTAAYALARRDLAAGGSEGLRVVRVGRLLRVPRAALEDLVGGSFTIPADRAAPAPTSASTRTTPANRRRSRSTGTGQAGLPFAS